MEIFTIIQVISTHIVNMKKNRKEEYFLLKTATVNVFVKFLPAFMCALIINSCNYPICTNLSVFSPTFEQFLY